MPAASHSADEIRSLLDRLHGQEIASLQVLGINSLKWVTPLHNVLTGQE